jgi:hypothetical protein
VLIFFVRLRREGRSQNVKGVTKGLTALTLDYDLVAVMLEAARHHGVEADRISLIGERPTSRTTPVLQGGCGLSYCHSLLHRILISTDTGFSSEHPARGIYAR